jgi:hypothetical protein
MIQPKFSDCEDCVFFSNKRINPVCKHCDSGEFFEERIVVREKTNNELMDLYGEDYSDDE